MINDIESYTFPSYKDVYNYNKTLITSNVKKIYLLILKM